MTATEQPSPAIAALINATIGRDVEWAKQNDPEMIRVRDVVPGEFWPLPVLAGRVTVTIYLDPVRMEPLFVQRACKECTTTTTFSPEVEAMASHFLPQPPDFHFHTDNLQLRVKAADRSWFDAHPGETCFVRPYVPGEWESRPVPPGTNLVLVAKSCGHPVACCRSRQTIRHLAQTPSDRIDVLDKEGHVERVDVPFLADARLEGRQWRC